jgi:endonuclease/exonuclease/phosphatase family metal-dependent hydrolase
MKLRAPVVAAAVSLGLVTVTTPAAHPARVEAYVPVARASAPPHDVTVVSFNVCGGVCRRGEVEVTAQHIAATARTADVVLLQELCRSQFDRVRTLLAPRGFRGRYAAATVSRGCGTAFGVAVFVRAPVLGSAVLPLPTGPGYERRALLGVTTVLGGRRTFVATVHLSPSPAAGLDAQLATVADYLDAHTGDPAIVGGDFNSLPAKPGLRRFYSAAAGGSGHFLEADEFRGRRPVIGGAPTFDVADRKIDYVFFSAGDFARPSAGSEATTLSDHRVYEATARVAN